MFIGRTDAKAEMPILWPPDAKNRLIGKDPVAGKDWRQEEKGMTEDEMTGWHHWLDGRESEWILGVGDGQGGLACCDSWCHKESDMTKRLHFPFSLSRIGEGNGNPLQCSCLENPRDGGAWWAAISGVSQSQTRLKRLSSSSGRHFTEAVRMGFMIIYIKLYYKIYHKGQRRNKGNILLSIFYIVFEVVNYCYIEFSDMYILLHLK